ncbi:hypothetical protein HCU40_16640 [Pseudanabaena biceps]|nr:hypothetical protein [Pseudanabaena biceps]
MKDIGYYAGFLAIEQQQTIKSYELHQLCSLLALTSQEILEKHDNPKSKKGVSTFLYATMSELSSRHQVSLVRALCDRIEQKLIEVEG